MKPLLYILLLSFLVTSASSCCDDCDNPPNWTSYEYLDAAKQYIDFKPGTWWVYKKSGTSTLDTIEVRQYSLDTFILEHQGNYMYVERIEWVALSKYNNYQYRFYEDSPLPLPELFGPDRILWRQFSLSKGKPGRFVGLTNVLFYPFDTGYVANNVTHKTKLLDSMSTLVIDGVEYFDVLNFKVEGDNNIFIDPEERVGGEVLYSWSPHYGIVKMEHLDKNITWNLVDYNIIQ